MAKNDDKYTDPDLRSEIKEDVQAGEKGGKSGQWSARKAQMMASEYKKIMHERGEEPYTTDKSEKTESQKHLSDWTKEDWQTSDGKGTAKQDDGTEKRYLPKRAWENMKEEEKDETNNQKLEGSGRGEQHVPNTRAAKKARKDAQESGSKGEDEDDASGELDYPSDVEDDDRCNDDKGKAGDNGGTQEENKEDDGEGVESVQAVPDSSETGEES